MKQRDAAQIIFRTVVFAGAMLGTGCGGKKPQQPTTSNQAQPSTQNATPENATPADPCASKPDPCAANNPCRPRPNTDPCARPTGRGFVLS